MLIKCSTWSNSNDVHCSNVRSTGGVIGGVSAFEIGNEHQQHGTPHGHGQAHVVCIYQYTTLRAIAEEIEKAWNGILQ